MKSYISQKLIKYSSFLCLLFLLICGFFVNFYKPSIFYSQETEMLDTITVENHYWTFRKSSFCMEVYVFHFGIKEFYITKIDGENYNYLIGKKISYRYDSGENLLEIILNGKKIFSPDESKPEFIKWLIFFIVSLIFCTWLLILRFKNNKTKPQMVSPEVDEYFFDNWSIACKNGNCTLSYISRLDGALHKIKITNDEFLLAKQRKMLFEEFSSKYQLF